LGDWRARLSHYFFLSSRRRHTRFSRDWSSDVCSSDLAVRPLGSNLYEVLAIALFPGVERNGEDLITIAPQGPHGARNAAAAERQIGRASGRGRGRSSAAGRTWDRWLPCHWRGGGGGCA